MTTRPSGMRRTIECDGWCLMDETADYYHYILRYCFPELYTAGISRKWLAGLEECCRERILLALWVATGTGGGVNRCSVDCLAIRGITTRRHAKEETWNEDFTNVLSLIKDSFTRSDIMECGNTLARCVYHLPFRNPHVTKLGP